MMKYAKWIFIVSCLAGAVWAGVKIGFEEYPEVKRLREECALEQEQVEKLKGERDRLTREIHDLDEDPKAIERIARKEGWVRKGETVILIPKKSEDEK